MSRVKYILEADSERTGICPPCLLGCHAECDDEDVCQCPKPHEAICGEPLTIHGPELCFACKREAYGPNP